MDMNKMMKQVQKMQAELAKAQEELALAVVEGSSGGGAVKVEFTGQEGSRGSIDPEAGGPEDPSMLGDPLRGALNDGLRGQQALAHERPGPPGGGRSEE